MHTWHGKLMVIKIQIINVSLYLPFFSFSLCCQTDFSFGITTVLSMRNLQLTSRGHQFTNLQRNSKISNEFPDFQKSYGHLYQHDLRFQIPSRFLPKVSPWDGIVGWVVPANIDDFCGFIYHFM